MSNIRAVRALSMLLALFFSTSAQGYENLCSHPRITDNAIALLPQFNEFSVSGVKSSLEDGSRAEDVTPTGSVVVDHFYDPSTQLQLHDTSPTDSEAIAGAALLGTFYVQQTALARGDIGGRAEARPAGRI